MPIPSAGGLPSSERVVPKLWSSSSREVPPALDGGQQAELKAAVQELPAKAGIDLANWNWKVVRRFVQERYGLALSRSSCLNYSRLHGVRLYTAWGLC